MALISFIFYSRLIKYSDALILKNENQLNFKLAIFGIHKNDFQ